MGKSSVKKFRSLGGQWSRQRKRTEHSKVERCRFVKFPIKMSASPKEWYFSVQAIQSRESQKLGKGLHRIVEKDF
jgi:hypothetical protein